MERVKNLGLLAKKKPQLQENIVHPSEARRDYSPTNLDGSVHCAARMKAEWRIEPSRSKRTASY